MRSSLSQQLSNPLTWVTTSGIVMPAQALSSAKSSSPLALSSRHAPLAQGISAQFQRDAEQLDLIVSAKDLTLTSNLVSPHWKFC